MNWAWGGAHGAISYPIHCLFFWGRCPYLRFLFSLEARADIMAKKRNIPTKHMHTYEAAISNEPGWGYFQHTKTFQKN